MPRTRFLFLVFFISGFCGLLYQIIWLRMAFAAFGIITPVISVIVSVFMLGLSVGSWLGGRWVGPMAARGGHSAMVYYGGIEFMIGMGGLLVPRLFSFGETMLLSLGETDGAKYLLCSAAVITISILPWCIFMGATFPAMMAFVKEVEESEKKSFSFLYVANVLGAACGAALTALALVEMLGFNLTLRLGAGLNLGIAVACLLVGKEYSSGPKGSAIARAPAQSALPPSDAPSTPLAVTILFVTGFASMAMEVVWTRAFTSVMSTTIYAFAALLVTYLVATWLGSVKYRKDLRRNDVMPVGQLMAYLAVSAFVPLVVNDPRFSPHPFMVCLSIYPLCRLLGYLTPRLVDEYSAGYPEHAGKVYAVNILGCILGPLVAGYFLLPSVGVKGSLILLGLPFVVLFFVTFKTWSTDALQRNLCAGAAVFLFLIAAGWNKTSEDKDLYENAVVRRDHTATVISTGKGMQKRLYINGIGITYLTPITKLMAHFPILHMAEKPKSVLVICFGMGTTFRSAMSWNTEVYAAELVPSVRDAFGFYFEDAGTLLKRAKGGVIIDDGRRFLKRTNQKFDLITIDPPPPVEAAGSSLLYSREFYQTLKERLTEDGMIQQWIPQGERLIGEAAVRSFVESFPHVRCFVSIEGWGLHLLGSRKPIPKLPVQELVARLAPAAQADMLEWYQGVDATKVLTTMLANEHPVKDVMNNDSHIYISDDRPFNEYFLLRRLFRFPPGSTLAPMAMAIVVCGLIGALVAFRPRRAGTPAPADPPV